jgi:hypothetical protein
MNFLKKELLETDSFESLAKKLVSRDIISFTKEYIDELKATFFVESRDLLSAFMIYKYPKDVVGDEEDDINKDVIEAAKLFLECDEEDRKRNLIKYVHHFKNWKNQDLEILQSQLFNEYHQLNVDIANTEDTDKKFVFETVQKEIEKCALRVGGPDFVKKIKSYAPVLLDINKLKDQYNKAHYDLICEQFKDGDFEKVKGMFTFIKNVFKQLINSEKEVIDEIIDVDFIIQQLGSNSMSDNALLSVFDYMFELLSKIHSEARDADVKEYVKEMHNNPVNVPNTLFKVIDCIKLMVGDLEKLKKEK